MARTNKNYLWRKITSPKGSELRHGKAVVNLNGESMAVREPKNEYNKNSQGKLCPNHWMTDKLCMHRGKLKELMGKS